MNSLAVLTLLTIATAWACMLVGCSGAEFSPGDDAPMPSPATLVEAGVRDTIPDAGQSAPTIAVPLTECQRMGIPYATDPYTGIQCTSAGPDLCTCTPRK